MDLIKERYETERLILCRPRPGDAEAVFARYAADPEVARYMSWPRHERIETVREFLAFSDAEWARWPGGPLLIESREGKLLGGTGFGFQSRDLAIVGYVLARDAWGRGYASEALRGVVAMAAAVAPVRLEASCHADHRASARVMEKCGFQFDGRRAAHAEFPNLAPGVRCDVLRYSRQV
ncbi:MAG: GNAT family N-acetyltransferase [Bryobacteraceae bacterium]